MTRRTIRLIGSAFVALASIATPARAQMPDPKAMSGMPLPVGDLSPGTVTARVIRGQLSNPIDAHAVELSGAGAVKTEKTDSSGRATFSGLTPGTRVKLRTVVGSETIESQEFQVPTVGGIRVMLVAIDPNAATGQAGPAPTTPAATVDGTVAFGPETRFVIEIGDDALNVFNLLQITNGAQQPVRTKGSIDFDLPKGAVGVGMMEGSTPNAVAAGGRVSVNGPFPPGNTVVQFAYSLPLGADTIDIVQKLPIELPQVSLVLQKIGAMQLTSPNVAQRREMAADGNAYIVAQGGAIRAGETLSLSVSGLPSRPTWPRNLAVGLAVLILAVGAYGASRRSAAARLPSDKQLHGRRERLFADLTALEAQRRKGAIDAETYATRRESLVTALEDLYRGVDSRVREVA